MLRTTFRGACDNEFPVLNLSCCDVAVSPATMTGTIMLSEQKVAVITGASQGIGASLMKGFREIGYGVVAYSRCRREGHPLTTLPRRAR
jgi:hypothetical protein